MSKLKSKKHFSKKSRREIKDRARFSPIKVILIALMFGLVGGTAVYLSLAAPNEATDNTAATTDNGLSFKVNGPKEIVYNYTASRCDSWDIPDLPSRAFRNSSGNTFLYSSMGGASSIPTPNRRFKGSDLNHLDHPCASILTSVYDHDHSHYNDRLWMGGGYTEDGSTFYALVHQENHAEGISGCIDYPLHNCQYDSVNLAISTDGGQTFHQPGTPNQLVASVPYTFERFRSLVSQGKLQDRIIGYSDPSNIIKKDGYYYSIIQGFQQPTGLGASACLIRTNNLADPTAWRGWDGSSGFNIQFINPYNNSTADPERHACGALDLKNIGRMHSSLTYSTYFRKYVLFGVTADPSPPHPQNVYYSFSDDLIHWTLQKQLTGIPPTTFVYTANHCQGEDPIQYPSLIDPTSSSRNFETVNDKPYLYLTQDHYDKGSCLLGSNRDLIRIPLTSVIPPDITPPTVNITIPANGSTAIGRTISIKAEASDNTAIKDVEFKLDGVSLGKDSTSPYILSWDSTTVNNGSHVITAIATDEASNSKTSSPITINVSNILGDYDRSRHVDVKDLSVLLSHYGQPDSVHDLNHDNRVDIADLSILLANYGR